MMYRDLGGSYGRRRLPEPEKKPPRLSRRQQALLMWVIGIELLLLFIAPIGGSSIIDAISYIVG
jgi:hypothetical protein